MKSADAFPPALIPIGSTVKVVEKIYSGDGSDSPRQAVAWPGNLGVVLEAYDPPKVWSMPDGDKIRYKIQLAFGVKVFVRWDEVRFETY